MPVCTYVTQNVILMPVCTCVTHKVILTPVCTRVGPPTHPPPPCWPRWRNRPWRFLGLLRTEPLAVPASSLPFSAAYRHTQLNLNNILHVSSRMSYWSFQTLTVIHNKSVFFFKSNALITDNYKLLNILEFISFKNSIRKRQQNWNKSWVLHYG